MKKCKLCLCPTRIVKDIRNIIVSSNPSVSVALDEAEMPFRLYLGHIMRAKVQQDRIADVMETMKREGKGRQCVIYLDYKMKQLPKKTAGTALRLVRKTGHVLALDSRVL